MDKSVNRKKKRSEFKTRGPQHAPVSRVVGWKTRVVRGKFPDRQFDIDFWQEQGVEAIFAVAWEMICFTSMESNPHFSELLRILSAHKAEFLIVGGYAVMKYTEPRYTKDLDIWIRNSPQNAGRVYAALAEFGAPLAADGLTVQDFASSSMVYQIGRPPLRIDIITKITGKLERAIRRHGPNSRQAVRQRENVKRVRATCHR
jgi:hypothetical protein